MCSSDLSKKGTQNSIRLGDLNYYHIQVMLRMMQQFSSHLNDAESLNIELYTFNAEHNQNEVKQIRNFRSALVEKIITQDRAFAYELILPISALQRTEHSQLTSDQPVKHELIATQDINQTISSDHNEYDDLLLRLKQVHSKQRDCFFLRKGVLKHIYSGEIDKSDSVAKFIQYQGFKQVKLENLSQHDLLKEIIEAFTDTFSPSSVVTQKAKLVTDGLELEQMICDSISESEVEAMEKPSKRLNLDEVVDRIRRITKKKQKRFMITPDNYLKMRLLLQRAEIGIPSILLGESGCGKTFLIEFISEVLFGDEMLMMTFYSGVSERKADRKVCRISQK